MAGFTVMDMLNKSSRPGNDESPKARFRTKDISIFKIYRNEMNFYKVADIEELKNNILMNGLQQPLELVEKPCEEGEFRIVSGERRWEALKALVAEGHKEFEIATCKLATPQDDDEEQIEIISANAYRTKRVADIVEEEKRLKASLERMRAAGRKIKGYDLDSGRLRDTVASMMGVSRTKVAQIESVNNNLLPELREALNKELITFSAAYELSGMSEEKQREAYGFYQKAGGITHKAVKEMKKEREEGQQYAEEPEWQNSEVEERCGQEVTEAVSESDTGQESNEERQKPFRPGDDYEDAHPESITSLCYSCKRYTDCNVKTGTCRKCDRYVNKAEAEKTEEQRYSEEQDRIDRETRKKLREMEDEERMKHLPSDEMKTEDQTRNGSQTKSGSGIHKLRKAVKSFDAVCSGRLNFELCRNDRGYKVGDIMEMEEWGEGIKTGRALKAGITYILEDYTGLEEGYCILALELLGGFYWI